MQYKKNYSHKVPQSSFPGLTRLTRESSVVDLHTRYKSFLSHFFFVCNLPLSCDWNVNPVGARFAAVGGGTWKQQSGDKDKGSGIYSLQVEEMRGHLLIEMPGKNLYERSPKKCQELRRWNTILNRTEENLPGYFKNRNFYFHAMMVS